MFYPMFVLNVNEEAALTSLNKFRLDSCSCTVLLHHVLWLTTSPPCEYWSESLL